MSLSYSGLTNYGKATLPSVEAWNTNANIVKDPPRLIMTRKIDKVGDTSQFAATLAASDDRLCETINYYARGVNPMVSVSYGEAQTGMNTSANGAPYLPYRIMRDGAFRPPIWRQEDLLPLSRLPRNWTTVDARPFEVDFSKRLFNCGTAETTHEVKNYLLKTDCETSKTISAYPQLTAPLVKYMLKDPLAPGTTTNKCENREIMYERPLIVLAETRQNAKGYTNSAGTNETPIVFNNVKLDRNHPTGHATTNSVGTNETPIVFNNVKLDRNHPTGQATTNAVGTKETPIVFNNVKLDRNHPTTARFTNPSGFIFDVSVSDTDYERLLPSKLNVGGYDARPAIPSSITKNDQMKLIRVR
jgi:hypothetical protein